MGSKVLGDKLEQTDFMKNCLLMKSFMKAAGPLTGNRCK